MPDMIIGHLFGKVRTLFLFPLFPLNLTPLGARLHVVVVDWFCDGPPQEEIHNNHKLIGEYRNHILNDMNQFNLHLFVKAYER